MCLQKLYGDKCEPMHPSCGLFLYFIVLIDTSTTWSRGYLLSVRNIKFARFFAQVIRLQAQFPSYPI